MTATCKRLLWFLLAAVFFSGVYVVRIREDMVDFRVNYRAGERLRAGENLYQPSDGHFMFKYLPSSALLYVPFSYLPFEAAKAIWYLLTVICAIFLFYLSYRMVRGEGQGSRFWMIWPPLILAKFFFRELKLGQINTIVTVVMLFMIWYLMDDRVRKARSALGSGALWGLATALKPYAFIFFPYFIVKMNWRALFAGLGVIGAALLAPSVFYGLEGNLILLRRWGATLSQSTPSQFDTNDNVSMIGFLTKWIGTGEVSLLLYFLAVAALAGLVLVVILKGRRIHDSVVLEGSVLLISIPLVSPMGWDYTLLMSVLGVTLLVRHFSELSKLWRIVLVINFCIVSLTIYDVIGRELYGTFMSWSVLTVSFLIVIGCLAALRFRKLC